MVDLAPEGNQSLRDFYDAFTSWKWRTDDLIGELGLESRIAQLPDERKALARAGLSKVIDASLEEAGRLFATEEFQAFIVLPGLPERRYISARAWAEAFFTARLFLTGEVAVGHASEFDGALGRTLFVSRADVAGYFRQNENKTQDTPSSLALRDLLIGLAMDGAALAADVEELGCKWHLRPMSRRPDSDRFDPDKTPAWSLPMVLSWMVFRNKHSVGEAINEYRANWWVWHPFHTRLPVRGGEEWFEVRGAELRTLEPMTLSRMMLQEALERDEEYGYVEMSVKDARVSLWARLAEGALTATAIDANGVVLQIPAHEWPYLKLETDGRLMDRLVFDNGNHERAYGKVTLRRSDVLSIWQGTDLEPPTPPMMSWLQGNESWTFMEAAIWVGSRGRDLPSQQVADGKLEEKGAYALFKALCSKRGLVATGLNRKRLREHIPAEYWEMATMNPGLFRERHYVSFIDDILHGYGGQLTPVGEDTPRWFGIRLERDAMFETFHDIAAEVSLRITVSTPRAASTGRKLAVAQTAIATLFPQGIPSGLTEKELLATVNDWLRDGGNSAISLRTLARAKVGR